MPLSEHEQKILEEIERQLYEQDPKFARNVASKARKGHSARNLRRGIVLSGATLAYNGFKRGGEERAARRGPGGDSMGKRFRDQLGKVRKLRRRDSD